MSESGSEPRSWSSELRAAQNIKAAVQAAFFLTGHRPKDSGDVAIVAVEIEVAGVAHVGFRVILIVGGAVEQAMAAALVAAAAGRGSAADVVDAGLAREIAAGR